MGKALFWKMMERFGVVGGQFVIQVILARILDPKDYGTLSIMLIFTTFANVFIQQGFSTSLIQNKDVSEEDYSSIFWISLPAAILIYILLFSMAPWVEKFFLLTDFVSPFRVLCLILIPGAFNSVQIAKASREMDFKCIFWGNLIGIIVSGGAGIVLALNGAGVWSLVIQSLLHVIAPCVVMFFLVDWKPRFCLDFSRIKTLFSYGWKILAATVMDTAYGNAQSLALGKRYSSVLLGFWDRGRQFPQFFVNTINNAVQSVMLPVMSKKQDQQKEVKEVMRLSLKLSIFFIFPLMMGLIGCARVMIIVLLTEKWLPCLPFLQLCCVDFAFWPVHTCNLQVMNAVGRSDIFLKVQIIKMFYCVTSLIFAILYFDDPMAILAISVVEIPLNCYVNTYPNRRLIGYSLTEQFMDIWKTLISSVLMLGCVLMLGYLPFSEIVILCIQIVSGMILYFFINKVLKSEELLLVIQLLNSCVRK